MKKIIEYILILFFISKLFSSECDNWQEIHPDWIFCDDFESTEELVKTGRYFEYDDNNGQFIIKNNLGFGDSKCMEATWEEGQVNGGNLKVAFGRNPNSYMNKQKICPSEDFREIYYRMYLKLDKNWEGSPAKLSRATIFSSDDNWGQAMIAHLWTESDPFLIIDPASCVNSNGEVECNQINDFAHLSWLGNKSGSTPIFNSSYNDRWLCIEHHIKLNDPGQSNGIQEFWIDGQLEARRDNLNFTGTYVEYGINSIMFENYWNRGAVKKLSRYFDNIVISRSKIGQYESSEIHNKEPILKLNNNLKKVLNGEYISVSILNMHGKELKKLHINKHTNQKEINTIASNISQGVYVLKIKSKSETSYFKFPIIINQ